MKKFSYTLLLLTALFAMTLVAGCSKAPADPTDVSTQDTTEATQESSEVTETTTEATDDPTEETTEPSAEAENPAKPEDNKGNGSGNTSNKPAKPESNKGNGGGSSSSKEPAPHAHDYSSVTVVKPTCTSGGYTKHTCSCGASYTDQETSATGHSWGGWTTTKEPTTSAEGQQTRTCSVCGATENQSIAKLPAPALDLQAAMAQGNAYAQSQYGWYVDTSFNPDISGFEPPLSMQVEYVAERGQSFLNKCVRQEVDALYDSLSTGPYGAEGVTVNCVIREVNGVLWLYVCY